MELPTDAVANIKIKCLVISSVLCVLRALVQCIIDISENFFGLSILTK